MRHFLKLFFKSQRLLIAIILLKCHSFASFTFLTATVSININISWTWEFIFSYKCVIAQWMYLERLHLNGRLSLMFTGINIIAKQCFLSMNQILLYTWCKNISLITPCILVRRKLNHLFLHIIEWQRISAS